MEKTLITNNTFHGSPGMRIVSPVNGPFSIFSSNFTHNKGGKSQTGGYGICAEAGLDKIEVNECIFESNSGHSGIF